MTHDYPVSLKVFDFLAGRPFGWHLYIARSVGVVKGDLIKVIETDVDAIPTGNEMDGLVVFPSCSGEVFYDEYLDLMFVRPL